MTVIAETAQQAVLRAMPASVGAADQLAHGTLDIALDRLVDQLLRFSGERLDDDMALVLAENSAAPTSTV